MEDGELWGEKRVGETTQPDELDDCPSVLPGEFLGHYTGKGNPAECGDLPELRRQSSEYRDPRAARICGAEHGKKEGCN